MAGFIVTFTPCGHEQHYNGAPAVGSWSSCWGTPGTPGCQTQRKVKNVRPDTSCAICAELGIDPDHPAYDDPQLGDQWHGQYDPAHPENIHYEVTP